MLKFLTEWQPILSNVMIIIVGIFVIFLVNWIRNINKNLEQKGVSSGDSKDLKNSFKQVNVRVNDIQEIMGELSNQIKELKNKYGEYATHVVSVEKSIDTEAKKLENIHKVIDEKIKNVSVTGGGETSKKLLADLREKLNYIIDKFKVHDDQLVNIQKIVAKNRAEIDSVKAAEPKIPKGEIDKLYETIREDKNLMASLAERTENIQNKISEHSEQIEILQKIFEDIDADLVEMDKYFKSLSKSH